MEDDNGLELSLGLGCGGSSAKSEGKSGGSSDARREDGDRSSKLVDDFKNFLHGGTQKQDSSTSLKPLENFFNDLSKDNVDADAKTNMNNRGLWVSSGNRPVEIEDEKRAEVGNKRKMLFDETSNQKKHERDSHHSDIHDKKTSHISIATEDGSTAENEDMGESELEGSTSRLVSHHDDGSKSFIGVTGPSEGPREVRGFPGSGVADLQGQKRPNGSSETEVKHGSLNYGVPFPVRPVNVMNMPYSFHIAESNSIGAPGTSGGPPLPSMVQVMPTSNGEQRPGNQSVNPGNFPVMFGYSPVQLPTLDKDNSRGLISHLQQFHHSYASRGSSNLDKENDGMKIAPVMQVTRNSAEAAMLDGRVLERVKGDGKQHVTEEGSSSHAEDDVKGSSMNIRAIDASGSSIAEGLSSDFSAIKPGISSEVKFGGCGSYPNLPWVSTTGSGPNGRTISGVTYRFSANQIKIVCACHGSHMSPEEFIRHANEENVNPENGGGIAPIPSNNPAASAQS